MMAAKSSDQSREIQNVDVPINLRNFMSPSYFAAWAHSTINVFQNIDMSKVLNFL